MSTTLLVGLATFFFIILRRYIEFRETVSSIQNHPGFRTLLGAVGVFNNAVTRWPIPGITVGAFRPYYRKYEDFKYFGVDIISHISVFPSVTRMFYLADAAAIKEVTTQRTQFPKPVWQYASVMFFGPNIVASEADEWKKYKKIAAAAFSEPNNKMVWEETLRVMNNLFDSWGDQERVIVNHAPDVTIPIALFVIGAAGFGRRMSWQDDEVVPPGHAMTFKHALHVVSTDVVTKLVFPDWFLKYAPIKRLRDAGTAYTELEKYMLEMCAARRSEETKEERYDLFSNLLDASDEEADSGARLTDRELLGNVFILLLAGHETTAHTLCFTFALLALYPEEQERLYQHIKRVLKDGHVPRYEDIGALTRVEAVLYETLRLVPAVNGIPKYVAEDTTLETQNRAGEKVRVPIPRGSSITLHTTGLHHNPRYWDDPHSFKSDRFLGDWPRDAFLPFSGGARSCIGRRFFETEGMAIVSTLISRYRIDLKAEPDFAHETFEQKKARIMRARQGITTTPIAMPLVFIRR